jgi:hypothetical protein
MSLSSPRVFIVLFFISYTSLASRPSLSFIRLHQAFNHSFIYQTLTLVLVDPR